MKLWARLCVYNPEAQQKKVNIRFDKAAVSDHQVTDQIQELKMRIHAQLVNNLNTEQQQLLDGVSMDRTALSQLVTEYSLRVMGESPNVLPPPQQQRIISEMIDEVLGLGPIEPLLKDDSISEIMINGPHHIYVETKGKLVQTHVQFRDDVQLMNIIERIVAPIGRRIDEASPLVDARLPDGSRVNIIIPPLSLTGPVVTIRKFFRDALTIKDLIQFGTLSPQMAEFLEACVKGRLNILISGGTGSGKTTTLNVLSSFIPETERIITIEDSAELQLKQRHLITLETRPSNIEGQGQVSMRDLVKNALRMRPDRIVVGEVRSGEALDMLQAMNTGHDGSITTAHSNGPRDALSRLETMVLMAGYDLPIRAIREQIASAVDIIIHQTRMKDGSRRITHIAEVQGMEGDIITMQDIFRFVQDGIGEDGKIRGHYESSGILPNFGEKMAMNGVVLNPEWLRMQEGLV